MDNGMDCVIDFEDFAMQLCDEVAVLNLRNASLYNEVRRLEAELFICEQQRQASTKALLEELWNRKQVEFTEVGPGAALMRIRSLTSGR